MMKRKIKIFSAVVLSLIILMIGVGVGSVYIEPADILKAIYYNLTSSENLGNLDPNTISIIWKIRLPRAILAFVVGGALAVSGAVMQSVLKNPLASSFTLGVSSGASVGAGLVIITGLSLPFLGRFTLPAAGLLFGLATVYLAIRFTEKIDKNMENNTIVLVGMIFSLFINAMLTLMIALSKEHMQRLTYWQMGSFSLKEWSDVAILTPIVVVGILILMRFTNELDIMTFGEEQAMAIGVNLQKMKWLLLGLAASLTGSAIAFVGVVGFIDLVSPHVVRKIFGSGHRIVLPMSMLFGGSLTVLCDLLARTLIPMSELPVGAVTALIGSPFFAYVYLTKRKAL